MRTLLFLNGPIGCQTGVEDGFNYIHEKGRISKLNWFYFTDYEKSHDNAKTQEKMLSEAKEFEPELIVFFHLGTFNINQELINSLKGLNSKPIIAFDEGDMYGGIAKPVTKSMKMLIKAADVVSLRGLGKFYKSVRKLNSNIIYTPHHNDIARFDKEYKAVDQRNTSILLIGNKVKPRMLGFIRRLPGAKGREAFVKLIGKHFPKHFKLYGNGWNGFIGNQGPIDFYEQNQAYRDSYITVAYEHYPKVSYYFSNRLPMALMNGSLYVCHYHEGYECMFPNNDFIFFFKNKKESVDIINYLLSLSKEELKLRSQNAIDFAKRQYHPTVIWMNFFNNMLSVIDESR